MSALELAVNRLYESCFSFRLYAEHTYGLSLSELSLLTGRSENWISERIEAMRLCLEKQLRVEA